MPKTKEQYQAIRTQSQAAIMEAALELFATQGFHSTSISKIAKAAGISKGLMYNYFKSKEDLLRAILLHAYEEGKELVEKELKRPDTPKEQLEHIIDNFHQILKNDLRHWKLLTALSLQDGAKEMILNEVMPKKEDMIQGMIHLFGELGFKKPKIEAYTFGATMDGIGFQYMTLGDEYPLDEMIENLKQKYCK